MVVGGARCAPPQPSGPNPPAAGPGPDIASREAGCARWPFRYRAQDGTTRCAPHPPLNAPVQYLQLFSSHTHTDDATLAENVGMIWSATGGPVAGVPSNLYLPAYRIDLPIAGWRGTYLDWLYSNHPDWIMYQEDRRTPAWSFHNTQAAPFDIANPAAETWMLGQIIDHARGATSVSLDNVSTVNSAAEAGHYAGAKAPCEPSARPACAGRWVQDYPCAPDGRCSRTDDTWSRHNLAYLGFLTRELRRRGHFTWCNLGHDRTLRVVEAGELCDGILQEATPQHMDTTKADLYERGFIVDFLFASELYDAEHLARRPYIFASYLAGHDTDAITPDEEAWCLAWPLLVEQAPEASYGFCGRAGSRKVEPYPPSMGGRLPGGGFTHLPIGHAVEPPPTVDPYASPPSGACGLVGAIDKGVCARRYSNGWVFVDAVCRLEGADCSATQEIARIPPPPPTKSWWSSKCERVSAGAHPMRPATALVIAAGPIDHCEWPQP
jgi:hypothetical protein